MHEVTGTARVEDADI